MGAPIGYVYNGDDKIVMDPDIAIQNAVNVFFLTFKRTGSAGATVKEFNKKKLKKGKNLMNEKVSKFTATAGLCLRFFLLSTQSYRCNG